MHIQLNSLKSVLLFSLTVSALIGCAKSSDFSNGMLARNIVGGTVSTPEFQKQNGLAYISISTTTRQTSCAGTLISRDTVLTAAHCLSTGNAVIRSILVVFTPNVNNMSDPREIRQYTRRGTVHRIHESFLDPLVITNRIDLALIRLDSGAPADIQAVPLARTQEFTEPGMTVIQAGYGRTITDRTTPDNNVGVLRQAENMLILSRSENGNDIVIDETDRGSCGGDSGGPAFARTADGQMILAGVNSRGTLQDSCIGAGIYVNIASHIEWIEAALIGPSLPPRQPQHGYPLTQPPARN